ncbi:hypothetical protein R3P38DRAFT_1755328 [Favolaschia claudopus]|uniref:Uncharacterized protein n=1 Tax=Favolaschia claudopus TaxID=2862362 RepID=A0AAW0DGN8_9AGAR
MLWRRGYRDPPFHHFSACITLDGLLLPSTTPFGADQISRVLFYITAPSLRREASQCPLPILYTPIPYSSTHYLPSRGACVHLPPPALLFRLLAIGARSGTTFCIFPIPIQPKSASAIHPLRRPTHFGAISNFHLPDLPHWLRPFLFNRSLHLLFSMHSRSSSLFLVYQLPAHSRHYLYLKVNEHSIYFCGFVYKLPLLGNNFRS